MRKVLTYNIALAWDNKGLNMFSLDFLRARMACWAGPFARRVRLGLAICLVGSPGRPPRGFFLFIFLIILYLIIHNFKISQIKFRELVKIIDNIFRIFFM